MSELFGGASKATSSEVAAARSVSLTIAGRCASLRMRLAYAGLNTQPSLPNFSFTRTQCSTDDTFACISSYCSIPTTSHRESSTHTRTFLHLSNCVTRPQPRVLGCLRLQLVQPLCFTFTPSPELHYLSTPTTRISTPS